jgi:hypothetical protein
MWLKVWSPSWKAEGVESFLEKRAPHFPARLTDYLDVVPDWPARPAELT